MNGAGPMDIDPPAALWDGADGLDLVMENGSTVRVTLPPPVMVFNLGIFDTVRFLGGGLVTLGYLRGSIICSMNGRTLATDIPVNRMYVQYTDAAFWHPATWSSNNIEEYRRFAGSKFKEWPVWSRRHRLMPMEFEILQLALRKTMEGGDPIFIDECLRERKGGLETLREKPYLMRDHDFVRSPSLTDAEAYNAELASSWARKNTRNTMPGVWSAQTAACFRSQAGFLPKQAWPDHTPRKCARIFELFARNDGKFGTSSTSVFFRGIPSDVPSVDGATVSVADASPMSVSSCFDTAASYAGEDGIVLVIIVPPETTMSHFGGRDSQYFLLPGTMHACGPPIPHDKARINVGLILVVRYSPQLPLRRIEPMKR
jgi:hypothetical protein